MAGHRRTDVQGSDKCEMPGCKTIGTDFTFVSFAVNPKTKAKGMLLCPKHEAQAMKGQK